MRSTKTRWSIGALAATIALSSLAFVARSNPYASLRDRAFDLVLALIAEIPAKAEPVVVDIDRASLEQIGPWPWSREQLARLVEAIADRRPSAIGLDILLEGPDESSAPALARRLETVMPDTVGLARMAALPDGDDQLAAAFARVGTVLGVALDPERTRERIRTPHFLARGRVELGELWRAPGVIAPIAKLADASAGLGLLALPGDPDGAIRRAPLLAASEAQVVPGLAVELLRVVRGAGAFVLSGAPPALGIADQILPLGNDGLLRLLPSRPERWSRRTIPATDVLTSKTGNHGIEGRIVLVGGSAPELGGLRGAAGGHLVPSVQIQADALAQLETGELPRRPSGLSDIELAAAVVVALAGIAAGLLLAPGIGLGLVLAASTLWIIGAGIAYAEAQTLVDPVLGPVAILACFLVTALGAAAEARRRAALIRRRFEQHLAPAVVRRIVESPGLLKLEGEQRIVTALFTDVEGFTEMTERSEPHRLLAVLDRYFDELSRIVVEHGGMVDKIIGDAICAIFNAPLDLEDHARRAFDCALAIDRFSGEFRRREEAAALGFGRTRVGLETGPVIVGDVGGGRKLDYTAYGTTINTAARLEAANKDLGTEICLGPGTAAFLPRDILRPLGAIRVRGRSAYQEVFTCWPATFSETDRREYLRAVELAAHDPSEAARRLGLIGVAMADRATSLLAKRLGAQVPDIVAKLRDQEKK